MREVPEPTARPGHLLVRTRASLISAGTERLITAFARKSLAGKARARPDLVRKVMDKARRDGVVATLRAVMARLDEPLPLGYSAAGEVVANQLRRSGRRWLLLKGSRGIGLERIHQYLAGESPVEKGHG